MRTLLLALLLLPIAATAQVRAGIGVRINAPTDFAASFGDGSDVLPGSPVTFSFPVDINEVVRVEPLVGYSRRSVDADDFESTTTATTIGVIVSALVPMDGVTITPGVRLRNTRLSVDQDDNFGGFPGDYSTNVLGIGPLVGGEYRFSQRFRIGAEAGLEYQTVSYDVGFDGDFEDGDIDDSDLSVTGIQTTAAVSVRFFL